MPFTRIDLPHGKPPEYRAAVAEAVQQALHDALGVPKEESFQVLAEHTPGALVVDHGFLGVSRSADALIVQMTLSRGRDAEKKRRFYKALADGPNAAVGLRREDVVIGLVEVGREDWSFGNGEAQLAWQAAALPTIEPRGDPHDDPLRAHLDWRRRRFAIRGGYDRSAAGRAR